MHEAMYTAQQWIEQLGLVEHPEGGWFAETYRASGTIPATALPLHGGSRSFSTAIHFLLAEGTFSALHRLKSDELWHFYGGAPLTVHIITPSGDYSEMLLGSDPRCNQRFQGAVEAGCWFGAESTGAYSLVGCTVAPGFDFSDFDLAERDRLIALFPQHAALIARMTRS